MASWFMTFPQRLCTRSCYRRIEANDYEQARLAAVRHHGNAWAFVYPLDELSAQIERFGLAEITPAIHADDDREPQPGALACASCIGCGCTDAQACQGGCWWLAVDRARGRGVCSNCAHLMTTWRAQADDGAGERGHG